MIPPYDTARCMTTCSLAQICRRTEPARASRRGGSVIRAPG